MITSKIARTFSAFALTLLIAFSVASPVATHAAYQFEGIDAEMLSVGELEDVIRYLEELIESLQDTLSSFE